MDPWTVVLGERVMWLIPLVLSLTVHEWAHAWVAFQLGDETAFRQGRMTLDPLVHLDPVGTLLLPLLGVPFGWAKPVPIEPLRFSSNVSMRAGLALACASGPLSNLVLAAMCALLLGVLGAVTPGAVALGSPIRALLEVGITINLALAVFNLLPIPPLDGSRIVDGLLAERWRPAWTSFSRIGILLLVAVIAIPHVIGISPLSFVVSIAERVVVAVAPP
jgi:Zn-dependent protease